MSVVLRNIQIISKACMRLLICFIICFGYIVHSRAVFPEKEETGREKSSRKRSRSEIIESEFSPLSDRKRRAPAETPQWSELPSLNSFPSDTRRNRYEHPGDTSN